MSCLSWRRLAFSSSALPSLFSLSLSLPSLSSLKREFAIGARRKSEKRRRGEEEKRRRGEEEKREKRESVFHLQGDQRRSRMP
jgi:hypothetical protein